MRALSRAAGGVGTSVGILMIREVGRKHWVRSSMFVVGIAADGFPDVTAAPGTEVIWRT